MSKSFNYEFDDERGRHVNNSITINHYHMTPANPMSSLQNVMEKIAIMSMIANNNNNNALEDTRCPVEECKQIVGGTARMISSSDGSKGISYEIVKDDEDKYKLEIESLSNKDNYPIISFIFKDKESEIDFINEYRDIVKSVKYKLSLINKNTSEFIFRYTDDHNVDLAIAFTDTDYFTAFMNRFRKGYKSVSFKHEVAEKIGMLFKSSLSKLNYIIDSKHLYSIKFEAIDGMYHMKEEN